MTNPAPPKILKVLQKFCCGFAEQQNRSKTDKVPKAIEQNSSKTHFVLLAGISIITPQKGSFAGFVELLFVLFVQEFLLGFQDRSLGK